MEHALELKYEEMLKANNRMYLSGNICVKLLFLYALYLSSIADESLKCTGGLSPCFEVI